ncbi:MAG: hypothetical protein FWH26_05830 [Oscillospiraceae bacterium]|nr:hypothetical protein [Oscillospiraceae bacterium]
MMIGKMKAMNVAKGVGIGLAIGGTVGLIGSAMAQPKRNAKRTMNKAIKTVGNVLDAFT